MAALLLYSTKCKHSVEIIQFIQGHPKIKPLVQYHNVNERGVPPEYQKKINRVPTLLTKNGKLLVGGEIKQWLLSLLPSEISEAAAPGGFQFGMCDLESDESTDDSIFSLNSYGQSLQPPMTKELEDKINRKVEEAFQTFGK